jgi:Ricin-type beta-trefoil lectin domain-like
MHQQTVLQTHARERDLKVRQAQTNRISLAPPSTDSFCTYCGRVIYPWEHSGSDNQRFHAKPTSDGFFGPIVAHSGTALEVADSSTADGAQIIPGEYHGANNQKWSLEELPVYTEALKK